MERASDELLNAAVGYARRGWKIIPLHTPLDSGCSCGNPECNKVGKHPRIGNWQHDATNDPEVVREWWTRWPDANIGLSLDGHVVLDVDPRHGGFESLAELEAQHGILDPRALQRSGAGGWHYAFAAIEGVKLTRDFRPGLDLLTGAASYIVTEPSLHASGGRYEWKNEPHPMSSARDTIALTAPPLWLVYASITGNPERKKGQPLPDVLEKGQRHNHLVSAAGSMRRRGLTEEAILAALVITNRDKCKPPYDHAHLVKIAGSMGKYEAEAGDTDKTGDVGITRKLADVITANDYFARDAGGRLYHWSEGVYRPTGERFVAVRVKALCDEWGVSKVWTPELASRVEQWIAVDAAELWECPPLDTLNCRNGLLDVATRTLRPHSPDHLSPVQIEATFDLSATCPYIDQFIRDVFPEDAHHLTYEVAAWLILPNMNMQKAVLLLGEGSNGKSGWLNLMQNLLGRSNVSALTLHKLEADKFAMARLVGKLANICADLPTSALSGTSMFKALTGNDLVSAERKYEASFEFRPFARLLFSANSAPRSEDSTHGFFRRWLVIPFTRTFEETDPKTIPPEILKARLSAPGELSGLLNKALDALPAIAGGRFTESASTRLAADEFRRTTDPLAVWLDQETVERADSFIAKDQLRRAYGQVCRDNGRPIMGDVQFTGALKKLRPKVEPTRRRVDGRQLQVFVGLGLVTRDPEPGGLF